MICRIPVVLAIGLAAGAACADDPHQHDAPVVGLANPGGMVSPVHGAPASAASAVTSVAAMDPEIRSLGSYAVGFKVGRDLIGTFADTLDGAKAAEGLVDGLAGKSPKDGEKLGVMMPKFIQAVQGIVEAQQAAKAKEEAVQAEANKKAGEEYLAKNKSRPGVMTTTSGLQYEILTEGKGPKPKSTDRVSVHYRGTLVDGREFDSSHKRGEPATFGVTQVIPGWVEALQMMTVGSKWKLHIPSSLAYGPRPMGSLIGPNSTLVFEVELLAIK